MQQSAEFTTPSVNVHFIQSIPVETSSGKCSWNWIDVDVDTVNNMTRADFKTQNFRICPYVMDLNAFKFFQYQVQNCFILN